MECSGWGGWPEITYSKSLNLEMAEGHMAGEGRVRTGTQLS